MKAGPRSLFSWMASIGLVLTSLCAATYAEEEYIGVFRSGQGANLIDRHATWADLLAEGEKRVRQNLHLVDVEAIQKGNQTEYISIWQSGTDSGNMVQRSHTWEEFRSQGNKLIAKDLRLVDLEVMGCTPSSRSFVGVWRRGTDAGNLVQRSESWQEFLAKGGELINQKLRLVDVEAARTGSQIEYFGVWRTGTDPGNLVVRSESWEEFLAQGKELIDKNLRLVDVDVIRLASGGKKQYLGVWRTGTAPGNRVIRSDNWQDFLAKGQELAMKGLRLVDMSALGSPCPGAGSEVTSGASGQIGTQPSQPAQISRIEYLGNFPSHRQSGWSQALQGVANDTSNWFFTQQDRLWKFPVSHDLNDKVTEPNPGKGILGTGIPQALKTQGFEHYGDLDQHRGFLFIPLEDNHGKTNQKPVIAVFRASDLAFVGAAPLKLSNGTYQSKAGWVAIHPITGLLYTSNNTIDGNNNPIFIYKFNVQDLRQNKVKLEHQSTLYLRDEQGNKLTIKPYLQGGVFSSDGNTLFIVNGKSIDFDAKDGGIWVFDARSGKKLMKSAQSGSFKYEFHPGSAKYEEPEGIAFWDLDNGQAPRIPGSQLHVILLDKDSNLDHPLGAVLKDEFYLKHYQIHF